MSTVPPAVVTVVHSPACHLCDDAMDALAEIGRDFPLTVELVGAGELRGQALAREHRTPLFPLVLVDGAFFSFGRLPRGKLRRSLAARAAVTA